MAFITKEHHDTYPAIDPKRPELSFANKTIVITGAGAGIGRNTVIELAKAGSGPIHIIGRTLKTLEETKKIAEKEAKDVSITVHVSDVADEAGMKKAAAEIGSWDVFLAVAGFFPAKSSLEKTDVNKWWSAFEINVKGTLIAYQAFLPTHNHGASIVGFSTLAVLAPLSLPLLQGGSAYVSSKIGETKLYQYIAAENDAEDLQVVIIHPGIVQTAMADIAEVPEGTQLDTINLASHFTLWAASKEAKFAHGKFLICTWDVEEIKANEEKFKDPSFLTLVLAQ